MIFSRQKSESIKFQSDVRCVVVMVMPLTLLEKSLNKRVTLILKDSRVLEGRLIGYDEFMNVVLEDTEERTADQTRKIGSVILRGNNVVCISA